jgi:hypothetical protein
VRQLGGDGDQVESGPGRAELGDVDPPATADRDECVGPRVVRARTEFTRPLLIRIGWRCLDRNAPIEPQREMLAVNG